MMNTKDSRIEQAARAYFEAMSEARKELLAVLSANHIEYLRTAHPEWSHDQIDRACGDFLMQLVDRVLTLEGAREKQHSSLGHC